MRSPRPSPRRTSSCSVTRCSSPRSRRPSHPGGGGASVLEHVLGEDVDDAAGSRRVPDRDPADAPRRLPVHLGRDLRGSAGRATRTARVRTPTFGTGLRWLPAHHDGCATESEEEAELVADQIARPSRHAPGSIAHGATHPLAIGDFMVVAPYNDQVRLLRDVLDADARTRGVPVGTVDKFQGREAAVVFFTMTTSSAADMPRSADFLFSRNRLNVAISRARCLAYLVCTEELLEQPGADDRGDATHLHPLLLRRIQLPPDPRAVGPRGREPRLSAPRNSPGVADRDLGYPPQVSGIFQGRPHDALEGRHGERCRRRGSPGGRGDVCRSTGGRRRASRRSGSSRSSRPRSRSRRSATG